MLDYVLFGICRRDEIVDENTAYFGNLLTPLPNVVNTMQSCLPYDRQSVYIYLYHSTLQFSMTSLTNKTSCLFYSILIFLANLYSYSHFSNNNVIFTKIIIIY